MNDVFFLSCQFNLIQNIFIHIITQKIKKKPIIFVQFFLGNSKVQVRINPRLESLYVPMPINGLFPVISLNCIKHILVNPTINVNNVKRHETIFFKVHNFCSKVWMLISKGKTSA